MSGLKITTTHFPPPLAHITFDYKLENESEQTATVQMVNAVQQ